MVWIVNGEGKRVIKYRDTFLETDSVLVIVASSFLFIPFEAQFHSDPLLSENYLPL
jgi:hypothetical protein